MKINQLINSRHELYGKLEFAVRVCLALNFDDINETMRMKFAMKRPQLTYITIASPQIYSRHPVKVKVVTVRRNGQPPLGVAASRP